MRGGRWRCGGAVARDEVGDRFAAFAQSADLASRDGAVIEVLASDTAEAGCRGGPYRCGGTLCDGLPAGQGAATWPSASVHPMSSSCARARQRGSAVRMPPRLTGPPAAQSCIRAPPDEVQDVPQLQRLVSSCGGQGPPAPAVSAVRLPGDHADLHDREDHAIRSDPGVREPREEARPVLSVRRTVAFR